MVAEAGRKRVGCVGDLMRDRCVAYLEVPDVSNVERFIVEGQLCGGESDIATIVVVIDERCPTADLVVRLGYRNLGVILEIETGKIACNNVKQIVRRGERQPISDPGRLIDGVREVLRERHVLINRIIDNADGFMTDDAGLIHY